MTRLLRANLSILLLLLCLLISLSAPQTARAQGTCGPMDVVFIVDNTQSMTSILAAIKTQIAGLESTINLASSGNAADASQRQLGLVSLADAAANAGPFDPTLQQHCTSAQVDTFSGQPPGTFPNGLDVRRQYVDVKSDLGLVTDAAFTAAINGVVGSNGGLQPEATDESLNTIVTTPSSPPGTGPRYQFGTFTGGNFRPTAVKIAVVITDAGPGGFNMCEPQPDPLVDVPRAHGFAVAAQGRGIKVSGVLALTTDTEGAVPGQVLQDYATTTGGVFVTTPADGSGVVAAITQIINQCGAKCTDACPRSEGHIRAHPEEWPASLDNGATIGGRHFTKAELVAIMRATSGSDESQELAYQLIAALVNIARGVCTTPEVDAAINLAQKLLTDNCPVLGPSGTKGGVPPPAGGLPCGISEKSPVGKMMDAVEEVLDDFNGGKILPRPCKGDHDDDADDNDDDDDNNQQHDVDKPKGKKS